jgi:hypothetical protein
MANRFNDRDRFNDRETQDQNYFPRRDRERFRSEGQQGRSQDWRDISGQEDMDWYQRSGSQHSQQYGRGQEGRYENRGDMEGSRYTSGQERFSNQETNRLYGRGSEQYGRGYERWEDPEASIWGSRESRGFENEPYGDYERRYQQGGQQRFGQGQSFGQGQQFGEGQEWKFGQQGRSGQQSFGTQRSTGRFSGRGPKGYRRADDRILEDINERLTSDPDLDATEIEVQVIAGEIILSGTVDDRDAKRRAEDIAESVSGVSDVQNQIRVKSRNQEQFGQSFAQGGSMKGTGTGELSGFTTRESKDQRESEKNKSTSNKDK